MVKISYNQEFVIAFFAIQINNIINLFFAVNYLQIYPPFFCIVRKKRKCCKFLRACAENEKDFLKSILE